MGHSKKSICTHLVHAIIQIMPGLMRKLSAFGMPPSLLYIFSKHQALWSWNRSCGHTSSEYVTGCVNVVRRGQHYCESLCLCETGDLIRVYMISVFSSWARRPQASIWDRPHQRCAKGTSTFVYESPQFSHSAQYCYIVLLQKLWLNTGCF